MHAHLVGAYLPRLTPDRLVQHVEDDRWRFVHVGVPELQRQGFLLDLTVEAIEERAAEIAEEMAYNLERAALFEFAIHEAKHPFDPGVFEGAWEPAYLDITGQRVIVESAHDLPGAEPFRLAFWIHDWEAESVLKGPEGPIAIDAFQAVPERLWSLAPYAIVD